MTGGQPGRAESREFLPPCGRDPLSPEHTDQTTGGPLWIEPVAAGIWFKCQTDVRLADRFVSQNQAHAWTAPRKLGGPHIGGPGLLLDTSWIAPRRMPRLDVGPPPRPHGYGRPRRRDAKRPEVAYIAWARDVAGLTVRELASLLYASPDAHLTREIDQVKRGLRDGRDLYRERGVLPWAAYESGRPVDDWPADPVFLAALGRWKVEAQERLQQREAEAREAAFGEPVTPETMRRDAEELSLYIADPVGQRNPPPS